MTLRSEPFHIGKPVEYTRSPLRFVFMESADRILINGDQPTVLVQRLGNCLRIADVYRDYPRCIRCGSRVTTGRETMEKLLTGEVGGICHKCEPGKFPDWRKRLYEGRYDKR